MVIDYQVPFYSNTSDNTHCYQAALRMVLKYFFPNEEYSWEQLDKVTEKLENLWTWPMAGWIYLEKKGVEVIVIDPFDYKRFIKEGLGYIKNEYGDEVAKEQDAHASMQQGIFQSKTLLTQTKVDCKIPTGEDIKNFLNAGYLVICNVNAKPLHNEVGYEGHSVVITGVDDKNFILNDPGLPSEERKIVSFEIFEKAWAYPNEKAKNITAFRLKK